MLYRRSASRLLTLLWIHCGPNLGFVPFKSREL